MSEVKTEDLDSDADTTGGLIPEKYRGLIRGLAWTVMLLLPIGLYLPVIWFDVLIAWDDGVFVLDRPTITSWWSVSWSDRILTPEVGYPNPVPTAIAAIVQEIAGPDGYASGLHAVSLVVHVINTFLAYFVVRRLLPKRRETVVPFLVVISWTGHPAVVESITWLTNLKTLSAGLGFMVAFLCWDEYLRRDAARKRWLGLTIVGLVIGFGSRPEAGLVPVILGIWAFFRFDGERRKEALKLAVPLAVIGFAWAYLGKMLHDVFMAEMGTTPPVKGLGDHLYGIVESIGFYVQRMAGLIPSNPLYPRKDVGGEGAFFLGLLALIGVVVLAVWLWRTRRHSLLAVLGCMAIQYAPFSNISPLPRFVADAYLYLFGLFLVAFVFGLVLDLFRSRAARVGLLALWLGFMTLTLSESTAYVPRWATTYRLWGPMAEEDPSNSNPWHFMIHEAVLREDMDRAYKYLQSSGKSLNIDKGLPWYIPAIYDHAGETEKAFESAKVIYRDGASEQFRLARLTLDLLIHHERPISELEDAPGFATWVVEEYAQRPEWAGTNSPYGVTEERILEYLEAQGGDYLETYRRVRNDPPPRPPKGVDALF